MVVVKCNSKSDDCTKLCALYSTGMHDAIMNVGSAILKGNTH